MTTIATTMVHARVPKKLKNDAKAVLDRLGVSLSLLIEQAMRNVVVDKRVVIEQPLKPTPFLVNILDGVEKDLQESNKKAFSPIFTGADDMDVYLDNYVAKCK